MYEKEFNYICDCDLARKAIAIAKLHGAADPVPIDMDSEINIIKLRVVCRGRESCRIAVAKTLKKKTLLEEVLGLRTDRGGSQVEH
jgi:ribosomal silencing factor RsfS